MKKRIFCMLILALVLISLFAIGASADYYSNPIAVTYTMPTAGTSTEGFQDNFVLSAENSEIEIRTVYITNKNGKIVPIFVAGEEYICWVSFSGKNDSFAFSKRQNETGYKEKASVNGEELSASLLPGDIGLSDDSVVSIPEWDVYDISDKESAPFLYIKFSVIPESSPADRFKEVNISIAEDLAMTFYYTPEENESYTDYRTQATLHLAGGGTVFAELRPWETEDGKKAFTFTGIAPQCMCDELTQILQGKKEDGTWEDIAQMSCSVRDYCIRLLEENKSNEPLRNLIYDLLAYGSAAQSYRNYNTEKLADEGCHGDNFRTRFFAPNDKMGTLFVSKENGERFYGATLVLNNVNYICFVLDLDISQHSDYSVEIEYGSHKNTIPFSELEKDSDGHYRCYSPAISLCANDNEHGKVVATLYSERKPVHSVDYWVNCYVASKCNSSNEKLRTLVMRLYCFGQSARAYIS